MTAQWTAVVPTLGRSPWLEECLEAIRGQGGAELVVVSADPGLSFAPGLVDRVVPAGGPGFAAATNRGLAASTTPFVAPINDDAVVRPGWWERLRETFERQPRAAAAQGTNLRMHAPETLDGRGLVWTPWWQAVQIGHGRPAGRAPSELHEVFGVSATAAVYRREALAQVAGPRGIFDEALGSYYEDVDLAGRLRAAGWTAWVEPAAEALHAGSISGPPNRWRLIYGNRLLVVARLLGRGFWPRLPTLWLRDKLDLWHALRRRQGSRVAGIATGWGWAAVGLWRFARTGGPLLPLAELRRFRVRR